MSYTHAQHARAIAVAHYRGEALGIKTKFVQAQVGRTVCCAKLVTAWDTADGLEMWQLDLIGPIHGRMSAPAHRVRQCQGIDGLCSCAPSDPLPEAAANDRACAGVDGASACEVPDGNHGETFPEGTE